MNEGAPTAARPRSKSLFHSRKSVPHVVAIAARRIRGIRRSAAAAASPQPASSA